MKIVTIGLSPYLVLSRASIHADILKSLFINNYKITSLVFGHDVSYFFPETSGDKTRFYYEFDVDQKKYKIPIHPITSDENQVIEIYEHIKSLNPDLVITVGDLNEFAFMKAVKQHLDVKWLSVYLSYSSPLSEDTETLLEDIDALLCVSKSAQKTIESSYSGSELCYVGCKSITWPPSDLIKKSKNNIRFMVSGKSVQSDNIATVMNSVANVRPICPNIELYVHANVFEPNECNLQVIRQRVDPNGEFIHFPEKFISVKEGYSEQEYVKELFNSDVFISIPMVSGSSVSLFESLACGCFPIVSECGSNADIASLLEEFTESKLKKEDICVRSIELTGSGEYALKICDPQALEERIIKIYSNIETYKGYGALLEEFSLNYNRGSFLCKLRQMVDKTTSEKIVTLERI